MVYPTSEVSTCQSLSGFAMRKMLARNGRKRYHTDCVNHQNQPYIDTFLCTSCNDCLEVNPLLFVYNEEKQALLGDLDSATFAELVTAAELCPARCIHPGKPWNLDETDLDELIERAAPFNQ